MRFCWSCIGLLALARCSSAFWPFTSSSDKKADEKKNAKQQSHPGGHAMPRMVIQQMPPGMMPPGMMPPGMFPPEMMMPPGMPPGVMLPMGGPGVFGFDPFEDMHANVQHMVQGHPRVLQLNGPGGPSHGGPGGGPPMPMQMQIGNILDIFGDNHAGHVGRAEGSFKVDDDHQTRVLITATLPGYKMDSNGDLTKESPLSVKVMGRKTVVVSGTTKMGPIIKSWQRSFALPKGSDAKHIEVTYNASDGNLTLAVPRTNATGATEADDDKEDDQDDFLPPALRAMRQGLPDILKQLEGGHGQAPNMGGFLLPPMQTGPNLFDILNGLNGMHPRNQLPHTHPVPEHAIVNLVGCFEESQLSKAELKYYGEANAVNFAGMYWHARADHVPYFTMARHEAQLGHGYTFRNFTHEDEKPKWGVYDGCGSPCEDDSKRWCGCAHEAERGFPNWDCGESGPKAKQLVRRYAVYKIGNSPKGDDTIRFKSKPDMCFNAHSGNLKDEDVIQLLICSVSPNEQFDFRESDHTIRVKSKPEMCLTARGGSLQEGDRIQLNKCSGGTHEQFEFRDSDNTIRSTSKPEMCLHAGDGKDVAENDVIKLVKCTAADSEQFEFVSSKAGDDDDSAALEKAAASLDDSKIEAVPPPKQPQQPKKADSVAGGRPYWQLSEDGGKESIDVVVPKGMIAQPTDRQVLLYENKDAGKGARDSPAITMKAPAGAAPVSKVRLPVDVAPESCKWQGKTNEHGEQVINCLLEKEQVQNVRIKVIGEEL